MSFAHAFRHKAFWLGSLVVLVGLAAWGWVERKPLLAWHYTRGLAAASDDECGAYVDRLESLDADALPPLVRQLQSGDDRAKANCGWALAELARRWRTDVPACQQLSRALADHFTGFDPVGQREALTVWKALVTAKQGDTTPGWLLEHLTAALEASAQHDVEEARPATLALGAAVMQRLQPTAMPLVQACSQLVPVGLKDRRAECRVDAIRLAAAPGVGQLDRVAELLTNSAPDPAAEVRATALLALSGQEELFATDEVLPFLHDVDAEVRAVAEQTLKGRGLSPAHLDLARQMTDPRPKVRAQVPGQVHDFPDLDAKVWLDKLSRDSSPAVRAAVIRAAGEAREWQLADRLREMARGDPSPTVRQIARFYLQQQLTDPLPVRQP